MEIIKQFKKETGLTLVKKEDDLLLSLRQVHKKLYSKVSNTTRFNDWVKRNVFDIIDENDNQLYTWKATRYKTKGRPGIDYLVSKKDAKKIILRSRTSIGDFLLSKLIDFEENYNKNIKARVGGRAGRRSLTDAIKRDKDEPKHYHFSNETNMIYKVVFGMNAKKLKEVRGVGEKEDLRDFFTEQELQILDRAEIIVSTLIEFGEDYETRKEKLKSWYVREYQKVIK